MLGGFDKSLDKKSKLYISILVRLIDKSFSEYLSVKEYVDEEIKTGDKFAYRFAIINHLENCVNAINRMISIFDIIVNGLKVKDEKNNYRFIKKDIKISQFLREETVAKINRFPVSSIRNRIEHINEDIFSDKFVKNLGIDVDDKYKNICINNECISFIELAELIENYHNFVLEIFSNLPNRMVGGVYFRE
jgi:hypothetical protein